MKRAAQRPWRRPGFNITCLAVLYAGLSLGPSGAAAPVLTPKSSAPILEGRQLSFGDSGPTYRYPPSAGDLSGPVTQGDVVWLGVGPALYSFGLGGAVQARLDLSGPVSAIDSSGGVLTVTAGESGAQDTYTVSNQQVQERVVFPPDPAVTLWLQRTAAQLSPSELAKAEQQDPTNPFVALRRARAARDAKDPFTALSEMQRAAGLSVPFAAGVALAAELEAMGAPSAANLLLSRAARDYAQRGYDPALLLSRAALRTYGNPLGELNVLLSQNKLERADVWIRYLRQTSPRFEGALGVYTRYATLLDAQGRSGEAEEWRAFGRSLSAGTLYNLGDTALLSLRDAARLCALMLLLALGSAYLTLLTRVWQVQGQGTAALGGRWGSWLRHPLSRLRRSALAYAGLGEKLVVLALLLGLLTSLSAWTWAARTHSRLEAPALNIGTYGGAWFYGGLNELQLSSGPGSSSKDAALLRGLAAQLDGDDALARQLYAAGGDPNACMQNNLGVLAAKSGDPAQARELWRAALSSTPDLQAPAYNLGLQPSNPESAFQRQFRAGPRLCYPDQRSLVSALGGSLAGQLRVLARSPLSTLNATPTHFPAPLQWLWVGVLSLACVLCTLWLFIPPPSSARPSRSALFRLLALLLPGSALLDGAWGAALLLGWGVAISSVMAQRGLLHLPFLPLLPHTALIAVLVAVYSLNTLGLILQEVRLAQHKRAQRG